MFKQTSPKLSQPLTGELIDFGERNVITGESLHQSIDKKQWGQGNKCGHDPHTFRSYSRDPKHKKRSPILEEAINNLCNAYYHPKKYLSLINFNSRQKRSERREAIISVGQALFHYVDLATLQVGFLNERGAFIRPNLERIAKIAGISIVRAKRALLDLSKAGYLTITSQYESKLPSIRTICKSFFKDLGIDLLRLNSAIAWKIKKLEKIKTKTTYFIKSVTKFCKKTHANIIDKNKNLISKALEIHKQTGQSVESIYRQLTIPG
jgi:hypothetical protein